MAEIYTVGLDGPHRVGKGTQLALLENAFNKSGIPTVQVRGDGSRDGRGTHAGDPPNQWWRSFKGRLEQQPTEERKNQLWDLAARRLAHELIEWRDERLPEHAEAVAADTAVVLVDRSLVSRMQLLSKRGEEISDETLYPDTGLDEFGVITAKDVVPDVLVTLAAPADVLLGRLEPNDPKLDFRRTNIIESDEHYPRAVECAPPAVADRTVVVDANRPVEAVYRNVTAIIGQRLPEIQFIQ